MKKRIPRWVRIQRIQRDIPSDLIEGGVWKGNLRAIVQDRLEEQSEKCECIRCREVGHRKLKDDVKPRFEDAELTKEVYEASDGKEIFISYEDPKKDILFGHLRLRIPSEDAHRSEIDEKTGIVRMLYVFGKLVPVGSESSEGTWQHSGIGKKMLKESERIATEEYDAKRIAILSGIGSREYYRQFDYELQGCYMTKRL